MLSVVVAVGGPTQPAHVTAVVARVARAHTLGRAHPHARLVLLVHTLVPGHLDAPRALPVPTPRPAHHPAHHAVLARILGHGRGHVLLCLVDTMPAQPQEPPRTMHAPVVNTPREGPRHVRVSLLDTTTLTVPGTPTTPAVPGPTLLVALLHAPACLLDTTTPTPHPIHTIRVGLVLIPQEVPAHAPVCLLDTTIPTAHPIHTIRVAQVRTRLVVPPPALVCLLATMPTPPPLPPDTLLVGQARTPRGVPRHAPLSRLDTLPTLHLLHPVL